jgi:hypothetical protein
MTGTPEDHYKRALEARIRRRDEERGISGEDAGDLLELMKLGETIARLDLNKVAEERVARLSEKNRIVHDLVSLNKDVDRRLRQLKAPKKRKKLHWKTREKKRRDYDKNVRTPRVKQRKAQLLGERGWYPILAEQWRRAKLDVQLTEEEWNEWIAPRLGDGTPTISRTDTGGPISLGNVCVRDRGGRRVVFDGLDYSLRLALYIV